MCFAIDSEGLSQLLFPDRSAGAVENRMPIDTTATAGPPKEIRLLGFTVGKPFGVDTFMLLTSATPLADPTVLEGDAVLGRNTRGASDPLTRLLAQTASGKRGVTTPTPTEWSFERLTIQSVPGEGPK